MTMLYQTREMLVPNPELVPPHAGQWGQDGSEWKPEWGTCRSLCFMPWNPHILAEGLEYDEFNLRRALRDEGIGVDDQDVKSERSSP